MIEPTPRAANLALALTFGLTLLACDSSSDVDGGPGLDATVGSDAAVADASMSDGSTGTDAGPACPGLTTDCGGVCVVTDVDADNCGACGVVCGAGEACISGGCIADCPRGLTECDRTCVDTETDADHCGACGAVCGAGEGCRGGTCVDTVELGPDPAKCEGGGPPIVIRTADTEPGTCADRSAAVTFTYGLCACDAIGLPRLSSETEVDAFDSTVGPYETGGTGGGMAANGNISTTQLRVTGDLRSAGETGLDVRETSVAQQLLVQGNIAAEGEMTVGEDAWVAGEFSVTSLAITGALRTPNCSAVGSEVTSGSCVSEAVDVADPCACGADEIIPIPEIVTHYAVPANNDNALISLDPAVFAATTGGPRHIDLPCGYYYLDAVQGAATITAHGRTALFIGGDVDASAAMAFVVDPGSTLDVYVGGTLHAEASLRVGSAAYPRNVRFYVGGVDDSFAPPRSVDLESDVDLAGLFYAPNGAIVSSSTLEMYGAVFGRAYHNTSSTLIHFDASAVRLGGDCPPPDPEDPPPSCTSCRDCGNQACVDGECGTCVTDADCCAPLRCNGAGLCEIEIF